MQEAQEMFKNANKVTRPEKALILGFMAGSRGNFLLSKSKFFLVVSFFARFFFVLLDNPCPHLGNIVTIKLSEDEEVLTASDGTKITKIVETHFQMNYAAGEWKRIKKLRKMDDVPASASSVWLLSASLIVHKWQSMCRNECLLFRNGWLSFAIKKQLFF